MTMTKDEVVLGVAPTVDQKRDAVHVACYPLVAAETMAVGEDVVLTSDGQGRGIDSEAEVKHAVGVVDPFLKRAVEKGERFWLLLYPRTITDMKHHWTHPAFDQEPPLVVDGIVCTKEDSEVWLRTFLRIADCPGYDIVMAAIAGEYVENLLGYIAEEDVKNHPDYGIGAYRMDNENLFFVGRDAHGDIPDIFWKHVENVMGKPCAVKPKYFTCSC